jgi:hypothetical protein
MGGSETEGHIVTIQGAVSLTEYRRTTTSGKTTRDPSTEKWRSFMRFESICETFGGLYISPNGPNEETYLLTNNMWRE